MSIKVMDTIFRADLPPNIKYVLLALADFGNDYGEGIYPSTGYLAYKTGYSHSQVKTILRIAKKLGYIAVDVCASRYGTNDYKVLIDALPERPPYRAEGVDNRPPKVGGSKIDPVGVENRPVGGSKIDPESLDIHELNHEILPPTAEEKPTINEAHRERVVNAIKKGSAAQEAIEETVMRLFKIRPNWNTKTNRAFISFVKSLPNGQTLDGFSRWWYTTDWRGKKGQPPSLYQIKELWPQAYPPGKADAKEITQEAKEEARERASAWRLAHGY